MAHAHAVALAREAQHMPALGLQRIATLLDDRRDADRNAGLDQVALLAKGNLRASRLRPGAGTRRGYVVCHQLARRPAATTGFAMADDKTMTGGQDPKRINIHEDYELRDWAASLGVTPDELQAAVKAVGDSVYAVRAHLERTRDS